MSIENEDTSNLDDFIALPNTPVEPEAPVAEPAAKAEADEPELPLGDEPEGDEPVDDKPAKKGRTTSDRINKLTADVRHYQRLAEETDQLKVRLAAFENTKPLTKESQSVSAVTSVAPDPEQYQYGELDPQFMRDTAKHEAKLEFAVLREEMRRESEDSQQRSAAERETAQLREKADSVGKAGTAKYEDFEETVVEGAKSGRYALTKEMFEMAAETSVAADILYHLASNPEESVRVASLSPTQQAMWIARQEVKHATPAAPSPRVASQAPEPVASVRGSGSRATVPDDTDDLEAFGRKFFKK